MSDPIIIASEVSKTFSEGGVSTAVLNGVSMTVEAGERVAIIGSSGSGKSTLLHLLGGLEAPSGGHVTVDGKRMDQLTDRERGILRNQCLGFIYQFHHLLPEFTALENVAMPLLIGKTPKAKAYQLATDYLAEVGLEHRLKHKPGQLSGGERQRAAIARAMVTTPKAILADEPTGNLDQGTAEQIFTIIDKLHSEHQTAFVVVTHDMQLAARMDRQYRLVDGQLQTS